MVLFPASEMSYSRSSIGLEGVDVYDVPLFNDGYGGPKPKSSQLGCVNAVFLGAMVRVPFVYPPIRTGSELLLRGTEGEEGSRGIPQGDID